MLGSNAMAAAFIVVLASGCAQSQHAARIGNWLSPQPPSFLTGPIAVLLTNTGGFSAHVVMTTERSAKVPGIVSGELLGWEGKLLFAPKYDKATEKNYRAAGLSFVWDITGSSGFILSEALQAFAPMSSDFRATNIVVEHGNLASEKVDGHLCAPGRVTLFSSDGSTAMFDVWRATDAKSFPLRIREVGRPEPRTLEFSSLRLGALRAELFRPPEGFTRYESAEGMMAELATRQANLKRRDSSVTLEDQPPGMPSRPPGGH